MACSEFFQRLLHCFGGTHGSFSFGFDIRGIGLLYARTAPWNCTQVNDEKNLTRFLGGFRVSDGCSTEKKETEKKEIVMFNRISASLLTVIASAVIFVGIANAQDVTDLERVVVTATTSDNVIVSIPVDYMEIARYQRQFDSISDTDYVTDMSRAQVCQVLRQHPPQNCTTSNYPAAPGIPSASGAEWAGNGCGTGPFTTAFASIGLEILYPGLYSGDLNKPIKGNPSIDFTSSCNNHDELYTSGASKSGASKSFADSAFGRKLSNVCTSAPSDGGICLAFRDTYVSTVQDHGDSAYAADQQQLACSAWGSSMKKSGCS